VKTKERFSVPAGLPGKRRNIYLPPEPEHGTGGITDLAAAAAIIPWGHLPQGDALFRLTDKRSFTMFSWCQNRLEITGKSVVSM
jgi:hypothetical protein